MANAVNLNEVGLLTQAGKQYATNADENVSSARNHLSKMEGMRSGFKGGAGSLFQGVSATAASNHAQLGRQIAEQARRAVLAEKAAITGDEESVQSQQAARGAAESFTSVVTRPVNV